VGHVTRIWIKRADAVAVQIGPLIWQLVADPSTVVQRGPGLLSALALASSSPTRRTPLPGVFDQPGAKPFLRHRLLPALPTLQAGGGHVRLPVDQRVPMPGRLRRERVHLAVPGPPPSGARTAAVVSSGLGALPQKAGPTIKTPTGAERVTHIPDPGAHFKENRTEQEL